MILETVSGDRAGNDYRGGGQLSMFRGNFENFRAQSDRIKQKRERARKGKI